VFFQTFLGRQHQAATGTSRPEYAAPTARHATPPFLIVTDLDRRECTPILVREWLPEPKHPNLIFRVAVQELESWILADRKGIAAFGGFASSRIPPYTDAIPDPKRFLVRLFSRSRSPELRSRIVPSRNSTAVVDPDYNAALSDFVDDDWSVERACRSSESCRRAFRQLSKL